MDNWFGWCSLWVTIVIAILWVGNTPLHSDDFYYQRFMGPDDETSMWFAQGDYITSVNQVPESIVNHRNTVNGRFANLLYIAFQPLPVALTKYFCGLMLALLCFAFWKWCGTATKLKNNLIAIAIPLLLWTALQWNDQMQSSDFQFNYTLTSLLMVVCLIKFFNPEKTPGVWGWLALVVFSLMHECFTIVFGTFLGVQWLFRRDKKTFIAVVILVLGALLQYSPGTQDRAAYHLNSSTMQFYSYSLLISKSWISWVGLGWWLIRRWQIEKPERRKLDRFAWGLIGSWIASLILIILILPPQRAHWPNEVLGVTMVLMIILTYGNLRMPVWVKTSLLVVYCTWGASLVYWQVRVTRFTNHCIEELQKGNTIIYDYKGLTSETIPFWLMDMTRPQYNGFSYWEFNAMPIGITKANKVAYLVFTPSDSLPNYDNIPYIPGGTDLKLVNNKIFTRKHDSISYSKKTFILTFGKPTIATTPLDLLISKIKYGRTDSVTHGLAVAETLPVVVGNDTVDALIFEPLPRSVAGRPIIAAEWQN